MIKASEARQPQSKGQRAQRPQIERTPKGVLQLILNLEIGGAQEVVRTLVKYLHQGNDGARPYKPVVCAFGDGPLRPEIEALGVTVALLPQRRYSVLAFPLFVADMFRIWRALARLIQKHEIDIIQTHLLTSLDFLVLILKYTTRVRAVLWTFHSFNLDLDVSGLDRRSPLLAVKRTAQRLLYRAAARWVDGYIAISDKVREAMLEVIGPIGSQVRVIHNGVDLDRYGDEKTCKSSLLNLRSALGLNKDARLIAMVGTLKEVKGHSIMIQAMDALVPLHPDVHLLLIGDGDLRPDLEAQVAQAGLGSRVHFLGSRQDVPELLAASDLFVLPSLWEGLSMALLEAMATGLPIVASRVSGTVQAIVPDESGILIPPGEARPLAQALDRLLCDPESAREMGQAAKDRCRVEFSALRQANAHSALYDQLLGVDAKRPDSAPTRITLR